MLYGVHSGANRIGGLGEESPYADWFGGVINDTRNVLGLWNQAFPQAQAPIRTYVPVPVAPSGGMFGLDSTTLIIGALAIGGIAFFAMKR